MWRCPGRLRSDCRSDHKGAKIGSNNVQSYDVKNPQQLQEAWIPNTSSFCPAARLWHYVLYMLPTIPKLSSTGCEQQHEAVLRRLGVGDWLCARSIFNRTDTATYIQNRWRRDCDILGPSSWASKKSGCSLVTTQGGKRPGSQSLF